MLDAFPWSSVRRARWRGKAFVDAAFAPGARAGFLARFEISAPECAGGRSRAFPEAGNRVRQWMHERTRCSVRQPNSSARARGASPTCSSPSQPSTGSSAYRRARLRHALRLPPPRAPCSPGLRPTTARSLPGSSGAFPRWSSRSATAGCASPPWSWSREGADRGEPARGASTLLRPLPAGGEGGRGGAPARRRWCPGGRSSPRCRSFDGPDRARRGGIRGDSSDEPDRASRRVVDCVERRPMPRTPRRADDGDREPPARHGLAGVPGAPEEGQGRSVPRPAGGDRRAGADGGAGVAHRPAGEAEGVGSSPGEAGGRKRDGGKCTWPLADGGTCGATIRLQVDHVVPRGRAGRRRWRTAGSSASPITWKRRARPTATRSWTSSRRGTRSWEKPARTTSQSAP